MLCPASIDPYWLNSGAMERVCGRLLVELMVHRAHAQDARYKVSGLGLRYDILAA